MAHHLSDPLKTGSAAFCRNIEVSILDYEACPGKNNILKR
jgi:hypothetical protein